jgi:hypothetical protein
MGGHVLGSSVATPNSGRKNDVWSSPDGITWTLETGAAAWLPRSGFALMVLNNSLYVCGGRGDLIDFDDIWSSPDGKTWTRVATGSWGQRQRMAFATFNNAMFLAGGTTGAGGGTAQNDVYTSTNGGATWTLLTSAAFSAGRGEFSMLVYNNKLWVIGGRNRGTNTYFSEIYSSPFGNAWTWENQFTPPANNIAKISAYAAMVIPSPFSTAGQLASYSMAFTSGYDGFFYLNQGRIGRLNISINTNTPLNPTTLGLQYQMTSFQQGLTLLIKNPTNLWVMNGGGVIKVPNETVGAGYPLETVPGIVPLGGFVYVMDPTGLIHGSALDDPTTWPSLNVVGADFDDDVGVCLARYLNYVVAFGTESTQLFFDAGNSPGIAIQPYLNANMKVGCAAASTVAAFENTLVWVSNTREGERKVVMMNGITPTPISNVFIEKFLYNLNNIQGVLLSIKGHQFYILNVVSGGAPATLVFDFATKKWVVWTLNITGIPVAYRFVINDGNLMLHPTNGKLYKMNYDSPQDVGGVIPVTIVSPQIDGGTMRMKPWGRLDVVCDAGLASGVAAIDFSDDGGNTFGPQRVIDLDSLRPSLFRNGASRRRIYRFQHNNFNPLRLEALEQQIELQPV